MTAGDKQSCCCSMQACMVVMRSRDEWSCLALCTCQIGTSQAVMLIMRAATEPAKLSCHTARRPFLRGFWCCDDLLRKAGQAVALPPAVITVVGKYFCRKSYYCRYTPRTWDPLPREGGWGGEEVGLTRLSDACLICLSVQDLTFPDVNFRAVNKLYSLGRPSCLVPKYVPF